jgi:hypothetical protein
MKMLKFISFFIVTTALYLSAMVSCKAGIISALSCGFNDVSNAVAQALPGGTVQLPAGTATWSRQLFLNGVSLIGAGTNATFIVDEVPRAGSGVPLIQIAATSQLTEVSS